MPVMVPLSTILKALDKAIDVFLDELHVSPDMQESSGAERKSEPEWLTTTEAANLCGVCDTTIYNWIRNGKICPDALKSTIGKKGRPQRLIHRKVLKELTE